MNVIEVKDLVKKFGNKKVMKEKKAKKEKDSVITRKKNRVNPGKQSFEVHGNMV